MPYTGTPRTWVSGETVTAALMNSDVRDPLTALATAWTSYTPTLTQSATLSKTVTSARYIQVGKFVTVMFNLAITSSGTAGNPITVGLPVAAIASGGVVGTAWFASSGVGDYTGVLQAVTTTTANMWPGGSSTAYFGTSTTAKNLDTYSGLMTYEAA